LFKSKSRLKIGEEPRIQLKSSLNNVSSRKRLSAEEELEREKRARIELEKDFEELKRKNQIMSDHILFSKIQTAK